MRFFWKLYLTFSFIQNWVPATCSVLCTSTFCTGLLVQILKQGLLPFLHLPYSNVSKSQMMWTVTLHAGCHCLRCIFKSCTYRAQGMAQWQGTCLHVQGPRVYFSTQITICAFGCKDLKSHAKHAEGTTLMALNIWELWTNPQIKLKCCSIT